MFLHRHFSPHGLGFWTLPTFGNPTWTCSILCIAFNIVYRVLIHYYLGLYHHFNPRGTPVFKRRKMVKSLAKSGDKPLIVFIVS